MVFCILFIGITFNCFCQFWNDIGKAVTDVAKGAVQITTAPYQSLVGTAKVITGNGNVAQIYQPYKNALSSTGQAIGSTTHAIMNPQQDLYNKAQIFASNIGGPADFIFDIATFSNRYYNELGYSGGQYLANVLQGQNPLQVNALPLAAAIRAARAKYIKNAMPIPESVKTALRGSLPDATIDRAMYAIGKVEISLPGVLNFLNVNIKNSEGNHAVTVDDIIVFATDPGSYGASICHWTHEMIHVDQYRRWGIEDFAWKFVNTYPIEKEANQTASRITGYNCENGFEGFLGLAGGSSAELETYQANDNQPLLINQQTREVYVAQCFFNNNQYPAYYLITNTGKIFASNMYKDTQEHIGYSDNPKNLAFAWDIQILQYRYGVDYNGNIWAAFPMKNGYGQIIYDMRGQQIMQNQVIGYVQRFR